MPVNCCVKECKSRQVKGSPITFHKFPTDPIRCSQWVKNLGRENFVPSNSPKVCSRHFKADCFDHEKFGRRWLKSTAAPTIFYSDTATTTEANSAEDSNSETESSLGKQKGKERGSKRRRISYLGDFKDSVTYSTDEFHLGLKIANRLVEQQNKKIRCLKGKNSRLRKRVENLDATLEEYRKKVYIPSDVLKEALARNKKMLRKAKTNCSAAKINISGEITGLPTKKNEGCDDLHLNSP